ncbi:xanthine dehydrogenase small subunit [Roseibaca sp. Y0-43]|uniref:xanthine dehydrogenase small subunit n=1 Tax=Roseibaca sp. Y0-43 TaxID=2816854 RepID=UPI001D0C1045|nr:xanthine dehydrogenase small subunit [Roseibaca sp. Y0-43]MCC1480833.1 xanthine dehydrogenase small subunit [Roseibaca sp. Y0-43]
MARDHIRFLLNDREVTLHDVAATDTLLDHLRLTARLRGTKEGCAEGDCGACTVLVGRLEGGALRYQPVNACIRFLASCDGCHVVTVEHLRGTDGGLHPVQRAMVDHHGSQCGFCTPGFVMALYALWMENPTPSEPEVERALQGNLCRCTGYAPIIRAALAMGAHGTTDPLMDERAQVAARLAAWADGDRVEVTNGQSRAILPACVDDLAQVFAQNPDARIVAGATDVGLWVTKFLRDLPVAVFIGHLHDLRAVTETEDALHIGALVSYEDARAPLVTHFPHMTRYWDRIAGWQVRAMGTLGGNIANGSPIGDTPPPFIALGARLVLRKGAVRREMPLEEFFLDYGNQDRAPGEFVEKIILPKPAPGTLHAAYKLSKRRDEDITAVALGICLTVADGTITGAKLAFGGMAATPKRAAHAEAALVGQPFALDTLQNAAKALPQDFTPLSDMRASADYRMRAAQNLLTRFWLEQSGEVAALEDVQ